MRNKLGSVLMFLGLVMLAAAAGLLIWNHREADRAEMASTALLASVSEVIAQNLTVPEEGLLATQTPVPEMTQVEVDGHLCVGYLVIPQLKLELPILASCTAENLKVFPCLYSGTTMEDNLVLAAHNYTGHFGKLRQLKIGDEVIFVDMVGIASRYQVAAMDVVPPTAVEEVTSGTFDLALLTCTYGGETRLVVYCDRQ